MVKEDRLRPLVSETTPWFAFRDNAGDWYTAHPGVFWKVRLTMRRDDEKDMAHALEVRDALNRIYGAPR